MYKHAHTHSLQSFLCRGQQAPPWGLTVTSSRPLRPEPCRPISFVELMQPQGLMSVATAADPVGVPWQPWLQTGTHKLPRVNRVQTLKGLARDLRRPRCRVAKASFASMLFHKAYTMGSPIPFIPLYLPTGNFLARVPLSVCWRQILEA